MEPRPGSNCVLAMSTAHARLEYSGAYACNVPSLQMVHDPFTVCGLIKCVKPIDMLNQLPKWLGTKLGAGEERGSKGQQQKWGGG